MYVILVLVVLCEDGGNWGLFSSLRLSPQEMELNLLAKVRYDPSLGVTRSPFSNSLVFIPEEGLGNFLKAFTRYLLEPSYGKIYRE